MGNYDFHSRLDTLGPKMRKINSRTGTYRRGDATITDLSATPGRTEGEEFDTGGVITRVQFQHFTIDAADLNFGSAVTVPRRGDEFDWINGETYRVISHPEQTGRDAPMYEYITSTKLRLRFFAELIGTA